MHPDPQRARIQASGPPDLLEGHESGVLQDGRRPGEEGRREETVGAGQGQDCPGGRLALLPSVLEEGCGRRYRRM